MSRELDADGAAALLGVKKATLYVYVSRGLLTSARVAGGRARRYDREEILRLQARRASPAAAALSFGDPVLDTALTRIDAARGPVYRGHAAVDLARRGVTFEAVAHLLWTGALPGAARPPFAVPPVSARAARTAAPTGERARRRRPFDTLEAAVLAARSAASGLVERDVELHEGSALVGALLARFLEVSGARARDRADLDRALVLIADHELNPSTFTARVVASTGAPLARCVHAALLALSGPRHGGACDRIEALLDEIGRPARAFDVVRARLGRGEEVPGFAAGAYPDGDPRTPPLLELPSVAHGERAAVARALVEAMRGLGAARPSVDFGLVALARALGLAPGSAAALFAVGRSAGWVAHVLEQRASGAVVRPRARFVAAT